MSAVKFRAFVIRNLKYIIPAVIMVLCFILQIISRLSVSVSDFMNFGISAYIRAVLAMITTLIPFSMAETIIIMLPLLVVFILYLALRHREPNPKIVHILIVVLTLMYALFVLAFAPAYSTTSADKLFEIEVTPVSKEQLYDTADILAKEINELADNIDFSYGSFSNMNYSLDTLSNKLYTAYRTLSSNYPFIKNFKAKLKPIALSVPMTYTHISGVYTYYTGETNINTNFPDYTIPFTSAHEMAHARGFAREKEANFVAFLVCEGSDDPYIRYSGKLNMFEYITNALYMADPSLYLKILYSLDIKVRCELAAYSEFFDLYRDSTASEISGAVNDVYLKSQGQSDGVKSYGLVVDMAVSYILSNKTK